MLYTFPADTLKFLFYDAIKQSWHDGAKLSALESAIGGGLSGAMAAVITTPLDVVRTRIMTQGGEKYSSFADCARKTVDEDGWSALFAGLGPRVTSRLLGGAIQFSSYELSQRALGAKE
uniref:ADP,ATP carrier protein n=1 Tax=Eutreptiella gymnastica TaxID=73025 RepID=A0A7S4LJG0_9EUGL